MKCELNDCHVSTNELTHFSVIKKKLDELNLPNAEFKELHEGIRALGPKLVIITDGPKGLTASDELGNGCRCIQIHKLH